MTLPSGALAFRSADSPPRAHSVLVLAPPPTVTGHPAPSRWPGLPWSQNLLSTFSFAFNSHTPVFQDKVTFHFSFLKLERIHTTDFFFFLNDKLNAWLQSGRGVYFHTVGEACCFQEGLERLVSALGQSSIGVGGETCSCPLLPWPCRAGACALRLFLPSIEPL